MKVYATRDFILTLVIFTININVARAYLDIRVIDTRTIALPSLHWDKILAFLENMNVLASCDLLHMTCHRQYLHMYSCLPKDRRRNFFDLSKRIDKLNNVIHKYFIIINMEG